MICSRILPIPARSICGQACARLPRTVTRSSGPPATPDGTQIVGHTLDRNLFLNTGLVTLVCTMVFGSRRLLADLLARKKPQISIEGLAISRYGNNKEASKHGNPATAHEQAHEPD